MIIIKNIILLLELFPTYRAWGVPHHRLIYLVANALASLREQIIVELLLVHHGDAQLVGLPPLAALLHLPAVLQNGAVHQIVGPFADVCAREGAFHAELVGHVLAVDLVQLSGEDKADSLEGALDHVLRWLLAGLALSRSALCARLGCGCLALRGLPSVGAVLWRVHGRVLLGGALGRRLGRLVD